MFPLLRALHTVHKVWPKHAGTFKLTLPFYIIPVVHVIQLPSLSVTYKKHITKVAEHAARKKRANSSLQNRPNRKKHIAAASQQYRVLVATFKQFCNTDHPLIFSDCFVSYILQTSPFQPPVQDVGKLWPSPAPFCSAADGNAPYFHKAACDTQRVPAIASMDVQRPPSPQPHMPVTHGPAY